MLNAFLLWIGLMPRLVPESPHTFIKPPDSLVTYAEWTLPEELSDRIRPDTYDLPQLGLTLGTLTVDRLLREREPSVITGSVIKWVAKETAAERAGIQSDDILTAINGQSVASANHANAWLNNLLDQNTPIILELRRQGKTFSVSVENTQWATKP